MQIPTAVDMIAKIDSALKSKIKSCLKISFMTLNILTCDNNKQIKDLQVHSSRDWK